MNRVAIVFDNTRRPETTGLYCRRALGELVREGQIGEAEHFLPDEVDRIPVGRFDLFLFVDDGLEWEIPSRLSPSAWWAIDTHLSFDRCLAQARRADFVFAAQREGALQLRKAGIETTEWMPLACDPEIHGRPQRRGRRDVTPRYDVAFVGNVFPGERERLLTEIGRRYPQTFVGNCYFDEMADTYSSAKIAFNRSLAGDVNMRVFESLCSGALLLTNDLADHGQDQLFQDGRHLATYQDDEELWDKLDYYLTHDSERRRIAEEGRMEVLQRHTYRHRVEGILAKAVETGSSVPRVSIVDSSQTQAADGQEHRPSVRPEMTATPQNVTAGREFPSAPRLDLAAKQQNYFEFDRPDVLAIVPETAQNVLEIGCGGGRLGAAIKRRQPARVTGIELDPAAAERARERLDIVVMGDVETDEMRFEEQEFDCVVCADVLEHLRNPAAVLQKIHSWLKPGGVLVTSLPNVRHHTVVRSLLAGNWTYESAGLLDADHVRFFTRRGIEKLLFEHGFSVDERRMVTGAGHDEWGRSGRPRLVQTGALQVETASSADAEEFFAYQYLYRSSRVEHETALTSIVLVTHNQLAYTRACIDSLFRHTPEPFEMIVVDNASDDGTAEYVESLGVRLIRNEQNVGFPAGVNQGLQVATGDSVLLLNNDTLLTTGWLERLWSALRADERIGLVGPCSNCTAGPQRVDVEYDLASLDDFAWEWRGTHFGEAQTVPELTGFCLLIDRRVIEAIGLFDERFENGVYEDVDYCCRARDAGFEAVIAKDAFVHHFGHKSYQAAGLDQDQVAVESEQRFRQKWNLPARESVAVDSAPKKKVRTPRSLPWNDGREPHRKILELFPDQAQQVLVFVEDDADLILCGELRRTFGVGVTICASRLLDEAPFEQVPWDTLDDLSAQFDAIVVPHLDYRREPRALLGHAHRLLRPDGELICHAGNVRSQERIDALVKGTWTTDWRSPQLRFLTRRELEKLLFNESFQVSGWQPIFGPSYAEWKAQREGDAAGIGGMALPGMEARDVEELLASGFVVRAAKQPHRSYGVTSIVIVTFNQLDYTRRCVDSIRLLTDEPYELIFVDNGSTDGTPTYLQTLADATVICNDSNRGFPAAVNQGLAAARGEQVLLLNNDTIVTTGWLRRMLDALYSANDVGLVGPVSNSVSGEQCVPVSYGQLNELDGFAWEWGREHDGQHMETDRLVGFCLLGRRGLFDRLDGLDERFGIGNFEDDDFCRRARNAGFRAVIAADAFVHHFGSVSFRGAGVDLNRLLQENQQRYEDKWQAESPTRVPDEPPPLGRPRPEWIVEQTPDGLKLVPNTIKLSGCLIVRNNADTIRPCLESLRLWVDEIVVVDTGSKDATAAICAELGARVFHWPWRDDFAAARNVSLDHARGEWIFWMDSDDTLPAHCGEQLRAIADGIHQDDVLGYVAQVHCPGDAPSDVTVVDHVKLIRNLPDLRFEFRIHEQIIPSIRRAGGNVAWSDLYVVHSGAARTDEARQRKLERDFRLLEKELTDRPEHPFVLFNLGMTYADAQQYEPAIDYLQRCLRVSGPDESHVRKAHALLVSALSQLGRHAEAWDAVCAGLQRFSDDKELLFRQALLHHHFGRMEEAEQTYLRVLTERIDRHFTSVDCGIAGFKARHNLAVVYEDMGCPADAEAQWRAIVAERPDYMAGWRGLGELIIAHHTDGEIETFLQRTSEFAHLAGLGHYLRGRKALLTGDVATARAHFESAIEFDPEDTVSLNALCRWHFDHGNIADAIPLLHSLLVLDGNDAAAWHNLGTAHMANQEWEAAREALQASLRLRPDAAQTRAALNGLETRRQPVTL